MENFKPQVMDEYDTLLLGLKIRHLSLSCGPCSRPRLRKISRNSAKILMPSALMQPTRLAFGPASSRRTWRLSGRRSTRPDIKKGRNIDELAKDVAAEIVRVNALQGGDKQVFLTQVAMLKKTSEDNYGKVDAEFQKLRAKHAGDGAAQATRIASRSAKK